MSAIRGVCGHLSSGNVSRRTCSRQGPARLSQYTSTRLASRPVAVPRIASRSPMLMGTGPEGRWVPRPSIRRHSSRVHPSGAIKTSAPPPHKTASARARRAKPGANAPPSPSEAQGAEGGLRVGVGGAVLTSRTRPPTQDPPPPHPRQREPAGRSPARMRRQAQAKRMPRREDYGWGWAGRC